MNGYTLLTLLIFNYSFAFSTDEFMSCDRFYQSKRRARILDDIPCDMGSSMFCERKGSSYPEAAIWRFKEENRALMKRMYGDLESTSLYREMRSSKLTQGGPPPHDIFSSLQYDIRVGSGFQKESKLIKKVIRKKIRNEAVRSTTRASTQATLSEQVSSETRKVNSTRTTSTSTSTASSVPTSQPPDPPTTESSTEPPPGTTTTTQFDNEFTEALTPPTVPPPTSSHGYPETTGSSSSGSSTSLPPLMESTGEPSHLSEATLPTLPTTTAFSSDREEDTHEPLLFSTQDYPQNTEAAESREDFNPDEILAEEDAIFFDSPEEYDYNGPSENACPVKEEVLAPFWANNTRDQVLALLNLYPFEQYIHMETCQLENHQFKCNEGCRCEQQYRLHRLLAFDPTNECRGIFSDWFRFPSYCVCKCYQKKKPFLAPGGSGSSGRLRRKPRLSGSGEGREIPRKKK